MYSDGFKYWLAYKKNDISYFRCSRYKKKCSGRCVVENGKIRHITEHNHPAEPQQMLVDKFRKTLTQRASRESTDLYAIYWEEASQSHAEAALLYTYTAAESAMRKARSKQLPQAPNTIDDLGDILSNSNQLFRIQCGNRKELFYQSTVTVKNSSCAIFYHNRSLEVIERCDELHIDVSIESKPQTPPNYFLLTVHTINVNQSIPIIYVIMTEKNQCAYAAIFAFIRENLSQCIKPNSILTHYDVEILNALNYTFPEANIKGFWFEYIDDILRYMKLLGLQRETARGYGASFVRMLLVLPLLPAEYIAPGLIELRKWGGEKKIYLQQFVQLCDYIENTWIRGFGTDKISIFGLSHSIYNHMKVFRKEFKTSLCTTADPMIFQMLECLTHLATRSYAKIIKYNKKIRLNSCSTVSISTTAAPITTPLTMPTSTTATTKRVGKQILESIIQNANQFWIRTPVHLRSPLQFLQLSSHCIDDTLYFESLKDLKSERRPGPSSDNLFQINVNDELLMSSTTTRKINFNNSNNNEQFPSQPHYLSVNHQSQQEQQRQSSSQQTSPQKTTFRVLSKDPPPLIFFPRIAAKQKLRIVRNNLSTEPPPLVPIQRN